MAAVNTFVTNATPTRRDTLIAANTFVTNSPRVWARLPDRGEHVRHEQHPGLGAAKFVANTCERPGLSARCPVSVRLADARTVGVFSGGFSCTVATEDRCIGMPGRRPMQSGESQW